MRKPSILVAEDDPVFRRVIAFTLGNQGFDVTAVSDGEQAAKKLSAQDFDMLVTDHQMPRCSGIELIEALRADSRYEGLAVVLCTARGLELDKAELQSRLGLLEIMNKPFSPRTLSEKIDKFFRQSEQGTTCVAT